MEIKKIHIIGLGIGLAIISVAFLFMDSNLFFFILGLGLLIGSFPFAFTLMNEVSIMSEKEEMFLEFARNLVESVKTGNTINKSIIHLSQKQYGVLSVHIKKLANQISLGIPLSFALEVFAKDVNNKVISRAIILIGNAEKAGGDIGEILESVAKAVSTSDRLKKERKAAISSLVVQSYIIFFVFILIVLIVQFKIIPMLSEVSNLSTTSAVGFESVSGGTELTQKSVSNAFFSLLLVQGFFSGLATGKLAEGSAKAGLKHSFILMFLSFFSFTAANILFG